jgi:hypothetical protein
MAEKIVFGADIDNVTLKNIDGKLTAIVDVENAEDEFEVVTDYVEPQEDDDYYVGSVFAKFRHKATQLLTDAYKKEKKPRSAPVNESLDRQITALISVSSDNIRITPEDVTGSPVSNIDGKRIGYLAYNSTNVSITLNKSDYSNAKAFNEAFSGKAFTVTTKKRYAESEGHPVVKPTEIPVAYPTLPYVEKTLNPTTSHDSYTVGIDLSLIDGTEPANVIQNIRLIEEEGKSKTFTVHYTLRKRDGRELTGTHTFTGWYSFDRREVADYGNDDSVTYEKWEFEPFVLEGFYAKFTVNPQPYVEGTL